MMLISSSSGMRHKPLGGELSLDRRGREEFQSADALRSTSLVGVNMGRLCRNHRAPPRHRGCERHDIGAGSVEDGKDFCFLSEFLTDCGSELCRDVVVSIGGLVPDIHPFERRHNLGVHAGLVIAGEALGGGGGHGPILTVCLEHHRGVEVIGFLGEFDDDGNVVAWLFAGALFSLNRRSSHRVG